MQKRQQPFPKAYEIEPINDFTTADTFDSYAITMTHRISLINMHLYNRPTIDCLHTQVSGSNFLDILASPPTFSNS